MRESVRLEEHIVVNFEDGSVFVDGKKLPKECNLTLKERRCLQCLIDNYPHVASFETINDFVWEGGEWGADRLDILYRNHSVIKRKCQLSKKIGVKGDLGYRLNPEIKFEYISRFSLSTLAKDDIFIRPEQYIEPELWMEELIEKAFMDTKVHVISGERGVGKTELARYFAANCINDCSRRKDLCFKNIIFTSYREQGLENTITLLGCVGESEEQETYTQKINLLSKIEKPTLLIIDNYDNEELYKKELSEESEIYRELRNTGCHILFTSKINLNNCFGLRQTKLNYLPLEQLVALFCDLAEEIDEAEEIELVRLLIDKYLRRNTYLVRLTSRLTATRSLAEIIKAFKELEVGDVDDPIDGKEQTEASLLEQYALLFNMSSIIKSEDKCQLLYNMALLPLEGVSYNEFFETAFPSAEKTKYKSAFKALQDLFWVFLNHRQVTMHPLVREMVARQVFEFKEDYIVRYIRKRNEELCVETYETSLLDNIRKAISACDIVEQLGVVNFDVACLMANITSAYDILGNKEMIYLYGKKALHYLEQVKEQVVTDEDLFEIGRAYNVTGYAVLHVYDEEDSTTLAEYALYTAKDLIKRIQDGGKSVGRLYTENQGNIAALHLVKKEFSKALEIHTKNKDYRLELLKEESTKDNKRLLAAAYKGMATAYYYLSGENSEKCYELLCKSYKYHSSAVQCYEEVYYPEYHLDIVVADNRRVGTANALMVYLEKGERISLAKEIIRRMGRAVEYMVFMEAVNYDEMGNSLNNTVNTLEILYEEDAIDSQAASDIYTIAEHSEKIMSVMASELHSHIEKIDHILRRRKEK